MASVEAVREGRIGFDHLLQLARCRDALGGVFDEPVMLAQAQEMSVGKLHHVCQQARHAAEPELVAAEQAASRPSGAGSSCSSTRTGW